MLSDVDKLGITYPHLLWISPCTVVCMWIKCGNVDKLSTQTVDNSYVTFIHVDNVENLSTFHVDKSKYGCPYVDNLLISYPQQSLCEINARESLKNTELSTQNVDNSV